MAWRKTQQSFQLPYQSDCLARCQLASELTLNSVEQTNVHAQRFSRHEFLNDYLNQADLGGFIFKPTFQDPIAQTHLLAKLRNAIVALTIELYQIPAFFFGVALDS